MNGRVFCCSGNTGTHPAGKRKRGCRVAIASLGGDCLGNTGNARPGGGAIFQQLYLAWQHRGR